MNPNKAIAIFAMIFHLAGCWQSAPFDLATVVGILPCGKGNIVVSTLDICSNLSKGGDAADVARKLLCNYIECSHAVL